MKKIVLVIPTLSPGGAERVISELANEFFFQGNIVEVILLAKSDDFYKIDPEIHIHRLGFVNPGIVTKWVEEIKLFYRFRKLIKDRSPNIILSFGDKYNIFTLVATIFLDVKVFVSDRSNPKKKLPFLTELLRKRTYRYASGIIAQTGLAKEILFEKTKNKNIKVIPNPVKKIKTNNIQKERFIINVGRLVPEKGQKYLIDAFSRITDPSWKLVILGDGPLKQDLEKQAKILGIENRLIMPGSVMKVDEWLAKSSIFVFSSVSEGFPNALVEAMAAGLPVVSFDCDAGPRDVIIDGENGFLIPIKDVDLLSQKINELTLDLKLRKKFGNNAKRIKIKLDKKMIALNYMKFMSDAI